MRGHVLLQFRDGVFTVVDDGGDQSRCGFAFRDGIDHVLRVSCSTEAMTMVFVSHDMGVVAALCDQIVVLDHGRIVEAGPTNDILRSPQHPYTQSLLASIPRMPAGA